ncbi:MAG TPA: sigma-70 family RNA polymerase sigma factor [Acidobacteriaceae bacterium]|jgi:RNA polymerase sigma factor (TIGR02999 family)|nr:sigma-70 family RNA polymerase sigma factor [Acidobacteriaceae bacterium]
MDSGPGEVTQLLKAMHNGDAAAADRLLPLVYAELHRLARAYMRRERPDHTLQATALINEAYLRLVGEDIAWSDRGHFIGLAAHVMRRVLVDYARQHNAERRAGGLRRVEMEDNLAICEDRLDEVLLLDKAMAHLAEKSQRQAQVVEMRYFGGLSVEQIASLLGVAPRSVKRDWSLARIFLFRELNPGAPLPAGKAEDGSGGQAGGGEK